MNIPEVEQPSDSVPIGDGPTTGKTSGLSGGAWADIAISSAAVGIVMLYLLMGRDRREDEENAMDEEELNNLPADDLKGSANTASRRDSNGNLILPTSPTSIHDDTATLTNTAMDSQTAHDSVSNMSSRASMMGDSAAV